MSKAPWDDVSDDEQLFVLVTGANSGIGLGIGQVLIDDFLTSRPATAHLTIITTTRSTKKSTETTTALRAHLKKLAYSSEALSKRFGPSYDPRDTIKRVHLLSIQLDLCKLPSIQAAAHQLVHGTVSSPSDDPEFETLTDVKIPRLDSVIFNAGIGGWGGLDWIGLAICFIRDGWVQATTWPTFKGGIRGLLVDPLTGQPTTVQAAGGHPDELLGEVFCANVFGHYMLGHGLLPLLTRPRGSKIRPGRLVWESSIEGGVGKMLKLQDMQGVLTTEPYESSKRLTDVIALTANLPSVQPISSRFLDQDPHAGRSDDVKPRIYLTHPGVVHSTLFPLPFWLMGLYKLAMLITRWMGSPWHVVSARGGATAPVWLTLQSQASLDNMHAERVKWGSACDRAGRLMVKMSEVEDWGWEGKVEDRKALAADDATRTLRKMVGRKAGALDLTEAKLKEFEELGLSCWREMERLRTRWEKTLEAKEVDDQLQGQ